MPIQLSDIPRSILLLAVPISLSALAAYLESQHSGNQLNTLIYVSLIIAVMVTLTSRIAISKLKPLQAIFIFLAGLIAPPLTVFIVIFVPHQIHSLNPIPDGYYRLITDLQAMSITYWAVISGGMILAFRPRLPLIIIGITMAVAMIAPAISVGLVLEGDDLTDYARQVAFFSIFCTPTIPLGCLLAIYAPTILNQPAMTVIEYDKV